MRVDAVFDAAPKSSCIASKMICAAPASAVTELVE
jgi:hypothetical protein